MNDKSRPRGRPRTFDRSDALKTAMLLFWRRGYDGVSVAELSTTMGIAPASLYVAFGSKELLYREALQLYLSDLGRLGVESLEGEPHARQGVHAVLRTAAMAFTRPDMPQGCMVGVGALRCAEGNRMVEEATAELRRLSAKTLYRRLERARKEGELGKDAALQTLADFYSAVIEGMSVLACDGASRDRLMRMADMAMTAWPAA